MSSQVEPEPRTVKTGMRGILIAAAILVLGVGFPLFLFPKNTDVDFAWTIASPVMAAALGASYLSASVLEALAARASTWANARIAVPTVFIFTTLTLAITFIHIDRFHLGAGSFPARFIAWVWLGVYVIVPIILGIQWFRQTRTPRPDPKPVAPISPQSRAFWFGSSPILLLLGVYLLVAPLSAAAFWPWALTPLTGRAVGAWLIGFGVVSAHAGLERDLVRLYPIFPALTLFAVLQGIVLVRFHAELDWARPSAWVYALVLASWLAIGLHSWMSVGKHQRTGRFG
jgi:hypothetical protein